MKIAQIWISTVIYVLIGITIISALLIATKPKIDEARYRFTINFMINVINDLDSLINEASNAPGERRSFELKVSMGQIKIIPKQDIIEYTLTTNFKFSEPGKEIKIGKINLSTIEKHGKTEVRLRIKYTEPINITTSRDAEGENLTLTPSSTPYTIWIENLGQSQIPSNANYRIYISVE